MCAIAADDSAVLFCHEVGGELLPHGCASVLIVDLADPMNPLSPSPRLKAALRPHETDDDLEHRLVVDVGGEIHHEEDMPARRGHNWTRSCRAGWEARLSSFRLLDADRVDYGSATKTGI
jgi:hypothetical protein